MKHLKVVALSTAVCFSLSACMLAGETGTREEDQTQTKVQGTALGALLGAGIGYAVGGKEGAAWGAALGAGTGFLLGNEVAKRKNQYASQEQAIAEETAWNAQFAQQVHESNRQLAQDIRAYDQEIKQLKTALKKGQATQADLTRQKTKIADQKKQAEQALQVVKDQLSESNQKYASYSKGGDPAATKDWKAQIGKLEKEKKTLESSITELSAMNSRL